MATPSPHTPDSAAGHREPPSTDEGRSQPKAQSLISPPPKTASSLQGFQREEYVQSFAVADDSTPEIDGDVKAIAFYLPQFHPIPENDAWWGKGFTEWTNVSNAQPLFPGHHQPQLPGELGFYDLRIDEVREQQAKLAREHGLHGFCYYYYWFNGRRILERPLQMMLDSGSPDFPFCICWANENWTRAWNGLETDVLIKQEHHAESDVEFIHDVLPILKDPRYIKVHGAPLVLVYKVHLLPDPLRSTIAWRQACREAGMETIHLCAVETSPAAEHRSMGFDSSVQFPPHMIPPLRCKHLVENLDPQFTGNIYDYEHMVAQEAAATPTPYRRFRGVMTSWDNTPRRRKTGDIWLNSSPRAYEIWLRSAVDATKRDLPPGERLVFINAWNEWAEGAHLEPDQKFGRAYLEATRRALTGTSTWKTLVEYARCKQEMSGAVLTDWIRDVETILSSQQISLRYLAQLYQPALDDFSAIRFSPERPPQLARPRRRFGGHGWLDSIAPSAGSSRDKGAASKAIEDGLPKTKHLLDSVRDAIFLPPVSVTRKQPLRLSGWSFAKGVPLGPTTPTWLLLEDRSTGTSYYGNLGQRDARLDVAALFRSVPESCTLFSGFSAWADIAPLPPGTYRIGMAYAHENRSVVVMFRQRICIA